ncbi:hypothetical protein VOI32_37770 [Paraburkholderia caribensis]|uniref:Uncharacterized protein n=2 Tax=Paraburkholderia TaxID=1822464 RepID=B2JXC1_PARP8|nr:MULTISPECIES: hypothetical protein [Paraburkholderia]ACC76279.1 hypothetical protein Bphy_7292 [Paraburkholderia phymatum STM815]MCO4882352.1 hypothetical protein [Paraburkholderia caribensis]PTB24312.1 hypothetical protein C9I56_34545 [Paraburkholderia caribensis]
MATRFELVMLALPPTHAREALPTVIDKVIAACWPGMSRAQLLDRARRLALRATLRSLQGLAPDGSARFSLKLTLPAAGHTPAQVIDLVARVRRLARRRAVARRATVSLPPPRDVRQLGLS